MSVVVTPGGKKPFWLHAWQDQLAGLQAFSTCIDLADVNGDGDWKLLVADSVRRLKVFGGTAKVADTNLLTVPSAVAAFYSDYADRATSPLVAVATGSYVFMYRNMKPHYRFPLPPMPISPIEKGVWERLRDDIITVSDAVDELQELRSKGTLLSTQSQDFLSFDNAQEHAKFAEAHKHDPIIQPTVVTCMAVLKTDSDDYSQRGCLVIGVECGIVYVLSSDASEVVSKVMLPSAPVMLVTVGSLCVQHRIIILCRNGIIYSTKDGEMYPWTIQPDAASIGIARFGNFVAVATTKNALHYYNLKGKKQYSVFLPTSVTNICAAETVGTTNASAVIVALSNGEIRTYNGRALLHTMQVHGVVTAMKYGRYGREDAALIIVLQNGTLRVEFLHRSASFVPPKGSASGPPVEQDVPIEVPRVTSVFLEQVAREKNFGVDMYRIFQRDLTRLRVETSKAYAQLLTSGASAGVTSFQTEVSLRLMTSVQGLGPLYKIRVCLQNTGQAPLLHLMLVVKCEADGYHISQALTPIPLLRSSLLYPIDVPVRCLEIGEPVDLPLVRVSVCSSTSSVPLASEIVTLPNEERIF